MAERAAAALAAAEGARPFAFELKGLLGLAAEGCGAGHLPSDGQPLRVQLQRLGARRSATIDLVIVGDGLAALVPVDVQEADLVTVGHDDESFRRGLGRRGDGERKRSHKADRRATSTGHLLLFAHDVIPGCVRRLNDTQSYVPSAI